MTEDRHNSLKRLKEKKEESMKRIRSISNKVHFKSPTYRKYKSPSLMKKSSKKVIVKVKMVKHRSTKSKGGLSKQCSHGSASKMVGFGEVIF